MTNYAKDVDLTVDPKLIWRPARKGEHVYQLIVGKAPSNKAKCRKCSQPIVLGELRCGVPIKHSMGEHGRISAWQHLGCTRLVKDEFDDNSVREIIYGLSACSDSEQNEIISEVLSEKVPEHLVALDPADLVQKNKLEEAQPPNDLLRKLLPYQKEGLGWLIRQEKCDYKGGILADEMGMGKTIQIISLLLAHRVSGPTLVVCPVSSMMQWKAEIQEHVAPGSLIVKVVSKSSTATSEELENADVVLTTYPIIELAWRNLVNMKKVPCKYCGLLFLPRQIIVHNKYFCGPLAKKTAKQMKRERDERNGGSDNDVKIGRRVQSKETISKGLRTLKVDLDEPEENTSESTDGKTIMGPIGMYQELMREAGRTVRGRWDKSRKGNSDDSSSNESVSSEESELSVDEESAENVAKEIEKVSAEIGRQRFDLFTCQICGFQKLRFPFCPKTGQHHIISEELRETILTDTGGDDIDVTLSPLHKIKWARIVLDEAHRIKERNTSTARSAFALTAEYRWCLTGTPLQNRVGDLYSLLRFLRVSPFCNYFCGTDGCSCSSLSHPFSGTSLKNCVFCGHGPVQHYAYFNKYILNPITRYGYIGDGRKGMLMLYNDVFTKIMLRRTKAERSQDLKLPPLEVQKIYVDLTKEERNFYESLYKKCTTQFDTFVAKGTVLHNYAHIFQLLSRLRQALDHPLLVVKGMDIGEIHYVEGMCGICSEGLDGDNSIHVDPCRHGFHRVCLLQFLESAPDKKFHCPTCFVTINVDLRCLRTDETPEDESALLAAIPPDLRAELESESSVNSPEGSPTGSVSSPTSAAKKGVLARIDTSTPLVGTKLIAIVNFVLSVPTDEKVIIFSQFGEMLDLTQYCLQRSTVKAVKLCGSLSLSQRQSVLYAFQSDPTVKVILISLKAGGEGLNLQNANHVILIDPWWNPAVEMQAVQRAHRIGQTRPVRAVRFVTRNSVEERMVELQDKKMLVFQGTVDGAVTALKKLTSDDLQFLFTR